MAVAEEHEADELDRLPRRRLRVPGRAAAVLAALREDLGAAGPMDRAVDAAAAEQRLVRRVDDRVHRLLGDVAADGLDHEAVSYPSAASRRGARSRPSSTNTLATTGSNCVPAHASISSRAASWSSASR